MNNVFKYINSDSQYYPTPNDLLKNILSELSFDKDLLQVNFLEPCAGDGAICRSVNSMLCQKNIEHNISCIEIEDILYKALESDGYNLVGKNFEEFESIPFYDLIVMNPPFNKGAKFLLKAFKLLNSNGQLICILNSETIKNPYNKDRELLKSTIERCGEVKFMKNTFSDSEHKSDVEIAVVYLKRPIYDNEFDVFGNIQDNIITEKEHFLNNFKKNVDSSGLITFDKIENAIGIYRNAVKHIFNSIDIVNNVKNQISILSNEAKDFNINIDDFMKMILKYEPEKAKKNTIINIRKMIWSYLLKFCDMEKYLFTKQKQKFYDKLEQGSSTLPFTKQNISQFFDNIMMQRQIFFEKGVEDLFNEITSRYNGNPYHSEGWKTNKNWKINNRIIVDWGITWDTWRGNCGKFKLTYSDRLDWFNDLDKIVRKIDSSDKYGFTIKHALDKKFEELGDIYVGQNFDNVVHTPYFRIKFYKKGTLHIEFKSKKILDQLNIMGGKLRKDLGFDG